MTETNKSTVMDTDGPMSQMIADPETLIAGESALNEEQRKTFRRLTEKMPNLSSSILQDIAMMTPEQAEVEAERMRNQTW